MHLQVAAGLDPRHDGLREVEGRPEQVDGVPLAGLTGTKTGRQTRGQADINLYFARG